jgi:hypothetical protein
MTSREPPHLDEGARENTGDPVPIRHLSTQTGQNHARASVKQLGERTAVVVGDPANQPPQSRRAAGRPG